MPEDGVTQHDAVAPGVRLPRAVEAERALLGSLLLQGRVGEVRDAVSTGEFGSERNRIVFAVVLELDDGAVPPDLVTVTDRLRRRKELTKAGGTKYLASLTDGVPRSANLAHYAGLIRDAARRRTIIREAASLVAAAGGDATDTELLAYEQRLREDLTRFSALWTPSSLEGVLDETAGEVDYLAAGLIPRAEVTILGAGWKTGKTLLTYRLALDLALGRPVYGRFDVAGPEPVAIFQLEMPESEDERRLRRIAIGAGVAPEQVLELVASQRLLVFNRPPMDLTTPHGWRAFHRTVRASGARTVIIDSLLAAYAGLDLNDNSVVRRAYRDTLAPLTSEGISVILLHHNRKSQGGSDDERSALLGAQAWGAAAGRVYGLKRLGASPDGGGFSVQMTLAGSWTPAEESEYVLRIEDVESAEFGAGTDIQFLEDDAHVPHRRPAKKELVANRIAEILRAERRAARKEVEERVCAELDVKERCFREGLAIAREKEWIDVSQCESGRNNELDLVAGEALDEVPA